LMLEQPDRHVHLTSALVMRPSSYVRQVKVTSPLANTAPSNETLLPRKSASLKLTQLPAKVTSVNQS
jgi:hypothetical protein